MISVIIFNGALEDPKLGIENIDCANFFYFPLDFSRFVFVNVGFCCYFPF